MQTNRSLKTSMAIAATAIFAFGQAPIAPHLSYAMTRQSRRGNRGNRTGGGRRPIVRARSAFDEQVATRLTLNAAMGATTNVAKVRKELRRENGTRAYDVVNPLIERRTSGRLPRILRQVDRANRVSDRRSQWLESRRKRAEAAKESAVAA